MSTASSVRTPDSEIEYPDSDGMPLADNTLQYRWITTIVGGLETLFKDDPNVFVAGDLLWYPVEGHPEIRSAPDALVAFGRPKGYRGSYKQWQEGGIAPQVVFEILSPGNRAGEMVRKLAFYDQHGVEEYYVYDPDRLILTGYLRGLEKLEKIAAMNGWVSPRTGVRFSMDGDELAVVGPDGRAFASYVELARDRDDQARRADEETRRADDERQRADRLLARLRALGIDPDE